MPLLVRKIDKAKWMQNDILGGEDVSADAITNCMKTRGNTLSTWEVSEEENIEEAVLAMVSAHQHLDTIDVVCLNPGFLQNQGIRLQTNCGNTPVKDLVDRHVDICDLTYSSLGTVAQKIVEGISNGKVFRYTKGSIKKLLKSAINVGLLQREDLYESVLKKL